MGEGQRPGGGHHRYAARARMAPVLSRPVVHTGPDQCGQYRFEGQYISYPNHADKNLIGNRKNLKIADDCLDESEIVTRMMFVINNYALFDLSTLDWSKPFEEQGIDSLESTALLTSFEHEFHTVFEDNLFDSFDTFE